MTHHPQTPPEILGVYKSRRRPAAQLRASAPGSRIHEIPTGVPSAAAIAADYRAWLAAGAEKVGMDPLEAGDAHWECDHGRLAHDAWRDPSCHCWETPAASAAPPTVLEPEAVAA